MAGPFDAADLDPYMGQEDQFAIDMGAPEAPLLDPSAFPSTEEFLADMASGEAQEQGLDLDWSGAGAAEHRAQQLELEHMPPEAEFLADVGEQGPEFAQTPHMAPTAAPAPQTGAPGADVATAASAVAAQGEQDYAQEAAGPGLGTYELATLDGLPSLEQLRQTAGTEYGDELAGMPPELLREELPLEDLSDEEFAQRQLEHSQALREEGARLTSEAMANNARAREENLSTFRKAGALYQQRSEKLLRKAEEVAEMRINPDQWWESRTTGQQIAAAFAALTGGQLGLLSGRGGNEGMAFIEKRIAQSIDAQKANIANARAGVEQQRGIVGQMYGVSGDLYEAGEAARVAAYAGLEKEIQAKLAQFDPQGTAALELEAQRRIFAAKKAEAAAALKEHHRKQGIEWAEHNINLREQRRKELESIGKLALTKREQRGLTRAELGLPTPRGGGRRGPEIKPLPAAQQKTMMESGYMPFTRDGYLVEAPGEAAARARAGGGKLSEKDQLEIQQKGTEIAIKQEELEVKQEGRLVPGVTVKGGKPYEAIRPGVAEKLSNQRGALDSATSIMDDILIGLEDNGLDLFGSPEGKRMAGDFADAVLFIREAKNTGALDEGSVKIISTALTGGSKSPEKALRDVKPALRKARQRLINGYNDQLRSNIRPGLEFEPYNPPKKARATALEKTPEQLAAGAVQGIPKLFASIPEKRAGAVAQMQAHAERLARDHSPSLEELRGLGKEMQNLIIRQNITADEAAEIAQPIAMPIAEKEKARFEKTPIEELEKEFGSRQNVIRYAETLKRVLDGDQGATFDFVIRHGYK